MFNTKFTTEEEAINYIAGDKVESCASALRTRFQDAIDKDGITDLNLAAEKAVVLHAHLDHGAGLNVPENFPFTQDTEAETHLTTELMALNSDGRAEERVDLTIGLYRRYREWGVNIFFSGQAAVSQAELEWNKLNPPPDLDESKFFELVTLIPDTELIEIIKETYAVERKTGKSVRESASAAVQAARFAAAISALFKGSRPGPNLDNLTNNLGL